MRTRALWVVVLLMWAAIAQAQPEVATEGQPSDATRMGTLNLTGAGLARVTVYVGQLTLQGTGDLLVSTRVKLTITGTAGTREVPTPEQVAEFLGTRATARPAAANPKAKSGYVLYRGFDGTLTVHDNRFVVIFRGTVLDGTAYGLGTATLTGEGVYSAIVDGIGGGQEGEWFGTSLPDPVTRPRGVRPPRPVNTTIPIGAYRLNVKRG